MMESDRTMQKLTHNDLCIIRSRMEKQLIYQESRLGDLMRHSFTPVGIMRSVSGLALGSFIGGISLFDIIRYAWRAVKLVMRLINRIIKR